METENNMCVICGQNLEIYPTVVVKERGLLKFVESSTERDDGKVNCFTNRSEITLHLTCRNTYNNLRCIKAVRKRMKESRRDSNEFDFQNNCLFCDKDVSPAFEKEQIKYPTSNRVLVGQVSTSATHNSIIQACTDHDDAWSQRVLLRINEVDIVEKNARYHQHCYSNFCHPYRGSGRPATRQLELNESVINHEFEFIEEQVLESQSESQDGIPQDNENRDIKIEIPDPIQQEELLTKENSKPTDVEIDGQREICTDTVDPLQSAADTKGKPGRVSSSRLAQKRLRGRDISPSTESIEEPELEPRTSLNDKNEAQTLRRKMLLMEMEFRESQKRARELHSLEIQLMKENIREARAKADLAELLLQQQKKKEKLQTSYVNGDHT